MEILNKQTTRKTQVLLEIKYGLVHLENQIMYLKPCQSTNASLMNNTEQNMKNTTLHWFKIKAALFDKAWKFDKLKKRAYKNKHTDVLSCPFKIVMHNSFQYLLNLAMKCLICVIDWLHCLFFIS